MNKHSIVFQIMFQENFNSQNSKINENNFLLLEMNIESRPFLAGDFTQQPVNKRYKFINFNKSNTIKKFHDSSFALPCHQDLTLNDIDFVTESIEESLNETFEAL